MGTMHCIMDEHTLPPPLFNRILVPHWINDTLA
jgi:hypothetical protein